MAVTIEHANKMDYPEFSEKFGNVVEHCDIVAASIWAHRPFKGIGGLHAEVTGFIDQLPALGHEGILRLHPDLAGRIASLGLLTAESTKEQRSAELNTLTTEEKTQLGDLNEKYKAKFGFPFVICARENKKAAILNGIATRLHNYHSVELATGIEEVKKIAFYRLLDLIQHTDDEGRL